MGEERQVFDRERNGEQHVLHDSHILLTGNMPINPVRRLCMLIAIRRKPLGGNT